MKHRCEKRTLPIVSPRIVTAPPSADFVAVHALTCLAQAHGWPERHGFGVAMQMFAAGISPAEAVRLFEMAEGRVQ